MVAPFLSPFTLLAKGIFNSKHQNEGSSILNNAKYLSPALFFADLVKNKNRPDPRDGNPNNDAYLTLEDDDEEGSN